MWWPILLNLYLFEILLINIQDLLCFEPGADISKFVADYSS